MIKLLFSRRNHPGSWLIRAVSWSEWSHVEIILPDGRLLGAAAPHGVGLSAYEEHMDDAARALNYDDIATACTYADEPAVTKFQVEGLAFRAWRSEVWATCYAILGEVNDGSRAIPTDEELLAELPELVLPR